MLAIVLLFIAIPIVKHYTYPKIIAVRSLSDISKGDQLNNENIELVKIGSLNLPDDIIKSLDEAIGRYAAVDIVKGDIIFLSKINPISPTNDTQTLLLPDGNDAILIKIRMIDGGDFTSPEIGDVIKLNGFRNKLIDIPQFQFVRVLSVVKANDDGIIMITVSGNENQKKYIKDHKQDIFYASVIVRGNEELAEKLLLEQKEYFKEENNG